jgi:hypothetical protein
MTREHTGRDRAANVDTDLVEYLVVALPGRDSVGGVAAALAELAESDVIRILDLGVVVTDPHGRGWVVEGEEGESLARLAAVESQAVGLLSDDDIGQIAVALGPDATALVVVAEDVWADRLAVSARDAGGRILAGERLLRARMEAALEPGSVAGIGPVRHSGRARKGRVGVLARPPSSERVVEGRLAALIVNPAEQLRELADLRDRGLLSDEEFERQRVKVLDG